MRGQSVAGAVLLGAAAAAGFVGCGDDDDRPGMSPGKGAAGTGGPAGAAGSAGAAGEAGFGAVASGGSAGSNLIPPPANVCDPAIALTNGVTVTGNTTAWPYGLETACALPGSVTGPEVAYELTANRSGILDVRLEGQPDFTISVRSVCADDQSELECSIWPQLSRPISAGDTVYVVVQGLAETSSGPFQLTATVRTTECGDGNRDEPEACDDGNGAAGDGCSASCQLESTESESNDTTAAADEIANPFFGSIGAGDVDVISVPITQAPSSIVATVRDFGDAACELNRLNSLLELLDEAGAVLAAADDRPGSYCSHLVVPALGEGTYFLRISASADAQLQTFPYALDIARHVCGNAVTEEGESCDPPAFGCNELCQLE
jgi:cysteine-rich repeat protein